MLQEDFERFEKDMPDVSMEFRVPSEVTLSGQMKVVRVGKGVFTFSNEEPISVQARVSGGTKIAFGEPVGNVGFGYEVFSGGIARGSRH